MELVPSLVVGAREDFRLLTLDPMWSMRMATWMLVLRLMPTHASGEGAAGLVVEDLTVRFGPVTAVQAASFSVAAGELVAVAGRSGAGKSTLLHALAGLVSVDSGRSQLFGVNIVGIGEPDATEVRRRMGFVFQTATLFAELSVAANVEWVGRLRGLSNGEAAERAENILDAVGIGDLGARLPGQLSGGQAQRVNIARALIGDVHLLMVDEPTASLDEENSHQVCALLQQIVRHTGVAALMVSHDPIVIDHADSVLQMESGIISGVA